MRKGEKRGSRESEAADPANGACEQPGWDEPRGLVHEDRVDWSKDEADERDGQRAADEGGDEPDDEFEAMILFIVDERASCEGKRTQ